MSNSYNRRSRSFDLSVPCDKDAYEELFARFSEDQAELASLERRHTEAGILVIVEWHEPEDTP